MDKVNITLDEGGMADADGAVERLRTAGVQVDNVLADLGIVSGSVSAEHLERVRTTPGVRAVEPEGTFQLPPPDSEVQ